MEPLRTAVLAIPIDVDQKTILQQVRLAIKERNANLGAAEDEKRKSQHKEFIERWCAGYEAKFGAKYAFMGGKDGEAVKKLLAFGFDIDHLMRIAKAAWEHPTGFFCKMAVSLTGFMSRINEIRAELNTMRGSWPKFLPPHVQLNILREMKDGHVCNPSAIAYNESKMTPEARKEYAEIKRKITEIEQEQRKRAMA